MEEDTLLTAPSTQSSNSIPEWALKDNPHHQRAREIIAAPTKVYPLGTGCRRCVARNRECIINDRHVVCASCAAGGVGRLKCGVGGYKGLSHKKKATM